MTSPERDEAVWRSTLSPGGPHARLIEELWWWFFWGAVVVLAAVVTFAVVAVIRSRRATEPDPDPEPAASGERRLARVVGVASGLTLLILIVLVGYSTSVGRALADVSSERALAVHIKGRQWWWEIQYPTKPESDSITTANELHVPVGRPVQLTLQADDVIHSLWIPALNGKQDLIPGRPTTLVLRADRAGVYHGQCAEFCGHQHAHMALLVIAEPPEAFQRWLEQQRRPAKAPESARQSEGQRVFLASQCPLCHTVQGTEARGTLGPDLTHFASRRTVGAGTLPNTRGHLAEWIRDPQASKAGNYMPGAELAPRELAALLDYLETLK